MSKVPAEVTFGLCKQYQLHIIKKMKEVCRCMSPHSAVNCFGRNKIKISGNYGPFSYGAKWISATHVPSADIDSIYGIGMKICWKMVVLMKVGYVMACGWFLLSFHGSQHIRVREWLLWQAPIHGLGWKVGQVGHTRQQITRCLHGLHVQDIFGICGVSNVIPSAFPFVDQCGTHGLT